jgi:carbon storage regulator
MLVLTRKQGEAIIINNEIKVTIITLQGGKIRLGIEAPAWVTVDRKEVHDRRNEFVDEAATEIEPV